MRCSKRRPGAGLGRRAKRWVGVALLGAVGWGLPAPGAAQDEADWRFVDEAFAELWFHGLAVVGFEGFGPLPLYAPGYRGAYGEARRTAERAPTSLEREAAALGVAFRGDDTFELFHFVPLYFVGVPVVGALDALQAVAEGRTDAVPHPTARAGARAVAAVLAESGQRQVLGRFVEALREEWTLVVAVERAAEGDRREVRARALAEEWSGELRPALATFLMREAPAGGTVLMVPALGPEGRVLAGGPRGTVVAVGTALGPSADDPLGALVRELCYPAVRRAFEPFESRFDDRMLAQRVSDQLATRCGEVLLGAYAEDRVGAYRARFGLPSGGNGAGFLSTTGLPSDVAALAPRLDEALRRELALDHAGHGTTVPVGRRH